jgi:prepilin-type N-terminal cleavage/methylation domain-containing protein
MMRIDRPHHHRSSRLDRPAFTITELLVALALIVLIMSILSQAFVEGLETFRKLKGAGDMPEELRAAVIQLRGDVEEANRRAAEMIAVGLSTGRVDPATVCDLKERYCEIHVEAAALDSPLRVVLERTTNPRARRIMEASLMALAGVRDSAARAEEVLDLIKSDGT